MTCVLGHYWGFELSADQFWRIKVHWKCVRYALKNGDFANLENGLWWPSICFNFKVKVKELQDQIGSVRTARSESIQWYKSFFSVTYTLIVWRVQTLVFPYCPNGPPGPKRHFTTSKQFEALFPEKTISECVSVTKRLKSVAKTCHYHHLLYIPLL